MIFEVRFYSPSWPRPVAVTVRASSYRAARSRARGLLSLALLDGIELDGWEIGAMVVLPDPS